MIGFALKAQLKALAMSAVMEPDVLWLIEEANGRARLQYAGNRAVDPRPVIPDRYLEVAADVLKASQPVVIILEIDGQTLVIGNEAAIAAATNKNASAPTGRLIIPLQEEREGIAVRCTIVVGRPGLKAATDLIVGLIGAAKDLGVPLVGQAKSAVEVLLKAIPSETSTVIARSFAVGRCEPRRGCEGGFPREGGILLSAPDLNGLTEEDIRDARHSERELWHGNRRLNVSGVTLRTRTSTFPSRLMESSRLAFENLARNAPIEVPGTLGPGARPDDVAWLNEAYRQIRTVTNATSVTNANSVVALDRYLASVPPGAEALRKPFESRRAAIVSGSRGLDELVAAASQWAALATKLSNTQATCPDLSWLDVSAVELDSSRTWFDGSRGDGVAPALFLDQKRAHSALTCVIDEVKAAEAPEALTQVLLGNQTITSLFNLSPQETISSMTALKRLPERLLLPRVKEVQQTLVFRANTIKDLAKACAPKLAELQSADRLNPTKPERPLPSLPTTTAELESFLNQYEYWRIQLAPPAVSMRGEGVGGGLSSP